MPLRHRCRSEHHRVLSGRLRLRTVLGSAGAATSGVSRRVLRHHLRLFRILASQRRHAPQMDRGVFAYPQSGWPPARHNPGTPLHRFLRIAASKRRLRLDGIGRWPGASWTVTRRSATMTLESSCTRPPAGVISDPPASTARRSSQKGYVDRVWTKWLRLVDFRDDPEFLRQALIVMQK